jgi:hypothetical protein
VTSISLTIPQKAPAEKPKLQSQDKLKLRKQNVHLLRYTVNGTIKETRTNTFESKLNSNGFRETN